ncbi:hypothetical protein F5X68DRAFT_259455 [Plectosphaerella plurivora]|uniref:Uncharacterized protein n=1 Tax=Plectosphaerella plurivora TaxID=936078 RepID=A0A9P8VGT3_9PEZI|nr:hypothetical protein F5X68DRAFT_259455 [Plectosphaerella plurivora]
MKCRIDRGSSCRRCLRSGVQCVFVPRANAAASHNDPVNGLTERDRPVGTAFAARVLRRLSRLESHLGLSDLEDDVEQDVTVDITDRDETTEPSGPRDSTLSPLWPAIEVLRRSCSDHSDPKIWEEPLIKHLWMTFHDTMLGLHFLPSKQTFSSPTPLMLAAMLYCSSMRGSAEVAVYASEFFSVLCIAISQLCIPGSDIGRQPEHPVRAEEWAFQTILGIILAGLLREGVSKETGVWISIAYRLMLEHCPPELDGRSLEWQRLFTGLQIVDLEHASIHLACPVIPIAAPFSRLRISPQDQLYRLSRMMHTGLTHFTGRGLPTIWSHFSSSETTASAGDMATTNFSGVDAAVIRDWARQLDDWLVEFGARNDDPEEGEGKLTFRQYVLHRVLVLSIYLPARGSDLFSITTPNEQHELLVSARAAVKLHLADTSIWSNFDLVVITWAALIIIQGVEGGVGEPDDLENVNVHLAKLREINEQGHNLHGLLATRLEAKLQGLTTPAMAPNCGFGPDVAFDSSWSIFNQDSLQTGYDMFFFGTQPQ